MISNASQQSKWAHSIPNYDNMPLFPLASIASRRVHTSNVYICTSYRPHCRDTALRNGIESSGEPAFCSKIRCGWEARGDFTRHPTGTMSGRTSNLEHRYAPEHAMSLVDLHQRIVKTSRKHHSPLPPIITASTATEKSNQNHQTPFSPHITRVPDPLIHQWQSLPHTIPPNKIFPK